jgi:hypothetical protein
MCLESVGIRGVFQSQSGDVMGKGEVAEVESPVADINNPVVDVYNLVAEVGGPVADVDFCS